MPDDLVAVEVEVDPLLALSPDAAAQEAYVELARDLDVVDGEGEVEGADAHLFNWVASAPIDPVRLPLFTARIALDRNVEGAFFRSLGVILSWPRTIKKVRELHVYEH